ncbi:hypothetical protein GDO81_019897 [Engystomops pustulosus]|uniref:NIDO domain-containing protein n=1 Tax=Engystomops pustulosus TaxID=76066 RepID=A0AAV6ZK97_ENGPU|nr:hypothetical protein GDO81_019897 [Engystomops pustulosus]
MSPDTTHSSMENMFLITSSPSQSPNDFRDGKETSDISPNLQDVLLSPSSAPIVENLPTETGYTSTTFTLFPDSTLSANPSEEKTSTDDTTYPEILSTSLDDTTFIDGYGTSQTDNSSPYPSSLDSSNLQDVSSSPSSAPTVENLFTETGYTSTTFTLVPESTLSSNPSQPKTTSILTVDTSLLDTSTSMSGDITFSDSNETPQPITYSANIHPTDLDTAKMSPLEISPSENPSTSGSTIMSDIDTLSTENPTDMNNTLLFPSSDTYNTSPSEIEGTSPYESSTNIPTTYIAPSMSPAKHSSTEKTGVSLVDTTYSDKSSTDDDTYTEILSTSPGDTTFIDGNGTSQTDNLSPYPSSASNPSSNVDMVDSEETSTVSRTSVTSTFETQTHTTFTPDNLSSSEKTPNTYTSFTTSITDNNSPADKSSGVILDIVPSESSVSDSTFTEIPGTITVDTSYSVESQTSYSVSHVDFSSQDISGTLRVDISSPGEPFSSSSITYPEDSTSTDILIVNISSPVESSDTQSSLTNDISTHMESKTSHIISPKNIISSDIPVTSIVDISSPMESQTSLTTSLSSDTAGIFTAKTISPEKSQTSHITATAPDTDTPVDITSPDDVISTDTLDTSTLVDNSSPEILSVISALIVPSPSGGTWPTSEGSGSTFSETYPSSSNDLLRSTTNIHTSTAPASLESTHQVSTSDTTSSTTSSENFNTTSSTTSSENLSMMSSATSSENFNTTSSTTSSENLRTTSSTTSSITSSITSSETLSTTSSTTSSKNFDTTSSTTSSENFGTTSSENLSTISSTTNSENFGTTSTTTPSVTVPSPSGSTWPTTESSRSILSSPVKISSAETVTSYPSSSNDLLHSTTNIHTSTAPASLESTHQVSTSDTTSSTTSGEIFGKTSSTTSSENFSTTSSTTSSENFDTTSSTTSSEKFDTTSSTISSENVGPTSTMIYGENLDTASSTTSSDIFGTTSTTTPSVPSPSGSTWPTTESSWSIFSSPVKISSAETVTSYPSSSNDLLRSTTNIHTSTAPASLESTHQVSTSDTTSSTTSSETAATTSITTPAVPSTTLPHLFNGTDLLYPFGPTLDSISLKIDDGGTGVIYLPINIPLFGNVYNILYVNNNGLLSFYLPIVQWYPQKLPVASNNPFLAVFWSDVDNTVAGDIYYRSSTEPELLARASSDIRTYFYSTNFTGSWVFVATWDRVAYYDSSGSKVNTFQCVLVTDGKSTYVLFHYEDMQWPTVNWGPTSLAGLDSGYNTSSYMIPDSLSPAIGNISSTSNVGIPGRWAFRVDHLYIQEPSVGKDLFYCALFFCLFLLQIRNIQLFLCFLLYCLIIYYDYYFYDNFKNCFLFVLLNLRECVQTILLAGVLIIIKK